MAPCPYTHGSIADAGKRAAAFATSVIGAAAYTIRARHQV